MGPAVAPAEGAAGAPALVATTPRDGAALPARREAASAREAISVVVAEVPARTSEVAAADACAGLGCAVPSRRDGQVLGRLDSESVVIVARPGGGRAKIKGAV